MSLVGSVRFATSLGMTLSRGCAWGGESACGVWGGLEGLGPERSRPTAPRSQGVASPKGCSLALWHVGTEGHMSYQKEGACAGEGTVPAPPGQP